MTFTKEQLIEHITGRKEFAEECVSDSTLHPERREYYALSLATLEIALAALESRADAEPAEIDERAAFNAWNNDTDCPLAGRDAKSAAWLAWSRRAAMLESSTSQAPAKKIAAPAEQAETLSVDTLANVLRNVPDAPSDSQGKKRGNSPAIPDGWIPVSERMPDETQPVIVVADGGVVQRTIYQFCDGVWIDWYEQYDEVPHDAFTHWQPLPAAPKQEAE